MRDPVEVLAKVCRILKSPPVLTLSEWADTYRILGPEESSEPGRWRTERTEYLREIMISISDPEVRKVVIMSSARVGKTSCINNAVGYFASQDPCPMLVVLPTVDLGKSWSKEQLAPMLRNTPVLRSTVAEAKSRDSGNSIQMKVFPGGYIAIAGANSPNGLSSRTCKVVIFDESDKIAAAAGDFGSPIELGKKRTTSYPGRYKHILASTPGIRGESVIEDEWETGDMCRYHCPCPKCGVADHLQWVNVRWPEGHPEEAVYVCPHCQGEITDTDKPGMLAKGTWVPSRKAAVPGTRSFHINELYSPWVTFSAMAIGFLQKKKQGPEALKTFVQESLGETWDDHRDQETKVGGLLLRSRRSNYKMGEIPDGVAMLVASVDTQEDRLEVLVMGIGLGGTRYSISHDVIYGNLALNNPWDELASHLKKTWPRQDGGTMKVRKATVDSGGHYEKQVMAFCRREGTKGIAHPIKGTARFVKNWVAPAKKRSPLMMVDVTAIKRHIYGTLRIEDPEVPGYLWFPNDLGQAYFDQLMSEHLVKGKTSWNYEPIKKGSRNEIIDLHTYCEASLELFKPKKGELEGFKAYFDKNKKESTPIMAPKNHAPKPDRVTVEDLTGQEFNPYDKEHYPEELTTPEPVRNNAQVKPRVQRVQRIKRPLMGW